MTTSENSEVELRREFDRADTNENGSVDEDEFLALVRALGVTLTPEEVQVAFLAIDINGNGRIEFGEFKNWWRKQG
ncbi:MAG TPA: EF-hand domain-containing protein [Polyangiaceae bacterium]